MSSEQSENNKRIAKNTGMLYIRMLLIMAVSLYVSRIVLNTLGVEDFGIYNIVGGIVTMFGFMNSAMATATQRFLSFEIGRKDYNRLKNVFGMSVNIHFIVALAVLFLGETIGLWFVNTQLSIPVERMTAAKWVYQFSMLAFCVKVISVPYNAVIIANERMNVFAWISIVEVVLNLLMILILQRLRFDKLILYSILMFGVTLIVRVIYGFYCRHNFQETKYSFSWELTLFKQLFSHSGWMLFGTSASMLSLQGINVLMNVFFGVAVNAARGIAYQIQAAVHLFINNFMTAVQPQIIKTYAQNNFKETYKLIFASSKFSYFLFLYISLPVLFLTEPILQLWLKIVPQYSVIFTRLTIIDLSFTILYHPIAALVQASGKIKHYQLLISIGFLLVFILSWLFYKLGYPSYYAFIIMIAISVIGFIARLLLIYKQFLFPLRRYFREVLVKIFLVLVLSIPLPLTLLLSINNSFLSFFAVCITSVFSTTVIIWRLGISSDERQFIKKRINQVFNRLKRMFDA